MIAVSLVTIITSAAIAYIVESWRMFRRIERQQAALDAEIKRLRDSR